MQYCESIYQTKRFKTRTVMVGHVGVGGDNPVRIQSMTTSSTRDVEATVDQIMRLSDAGCQIARVTVQGIKEAEACEHIKNGLLKRGYTIPLVADIHFFPPAAMHVADFVDKVRINPGNFVDKRASFKVIEYDDASYAREIERIEEKFTPLIEKCKRLKRSIRIGTNHGSLSDRIMNRYGDTPMGMVESAFEFTRVARKHDFHDIIFSMKSSNPQVMILAYRLLVAEMMKLGWDYPLHLGVTEAGQGEDGRVKSAMGIGALLLDGIGDTIRVSLTEDAWHEIDPCNRLVKLGESYLGRGVAPFEEKERDFQAIKRRSIVMPKGVAMHRDGTVVVGVRNSDISDPDFYKRIGCKGSALDPKLSVSSADALLLLEPPQSAHQSILARFRQAGIGIFSEWPVEGATRLLSLSKAVEEAHQRSKVERFTVKMGKEEPLAVIVNENDDWSLLKQINPAVIFLTNRLHSARQFFEWKHQQGLAMPVLLHYQYPLSKEDLVIHAAAECGALLCDGLGDGLSIQAQHEVDFLRNFSFNILQAARMRTFKTDFISCPSCGRTLFDLQEVTKRISARTAHLPGVKIAIMGCIVNGPGEMADADFGYVGSKAGMIDLYVGKTCVEKDIPFAQADDRLVELLKAHGRWQEPALT